MDYNSNADNYLDRAYMEGNNLLAAGDFAGALERYERVLAADPNFSSALYYKGVALNALRRYEEALACFEALIAEDPRDAGALECKGAALNGLARHEESLKFYKKALELEPANARSLIAAAGLCLRLCNYKDAIAYADRALEVNESEKRAWQIKGLALMEQGHISSVPHKFQEALKCFERALQLSPDDPSILKDKARALTATEAHYRAAECYLKALKLLPGDIDSIGELAKAYRKLNMFEASLKYYKMLMEASRDPSLAVEIEYLNARLSEKASEH